MQSHNHHDHHSAFPLSSANDGDGESESVDSEGSQEMDQWNMEDLIRNARERSCLLVIDGFVVDASSYVGEHVRGISSFRDMVSDSFNSPEDPSSCGDMPFQGREHPQPKNGKKRPGHLEVE